MVNSIWFILLTIGITYSIISGNTKLLNDEILLSAKSAFNLILTMMEVTVLWTGILNIAEKSNLLKKFSNLINPLLSKLFPKTFSYCRQ